MEALIAETVANDNNLQQDIKKFEVNPVSLKALRSRKKNGATRLVHLEELYTAGGLSRTEIEDQRLKQQLLEEEYELQRRRKFR